LAMMLRHSFGLEEEAKVVETAVSKTIADGHRTGDLARDDEKALSTEEITAVILQNM